MTRFIFWCAVFIAHFVDFSEHARGSIVQSSVCRHRQQLPPELGRSDGKHFKRAVPLFGGDVLRDGSLNGSP